MLYSSTKNWRYEVVRRNKLIYLVERVSHDGYRNQVRWFFSLNKAEACAQGLAEQTWTTQGPIMAAFWAVPDIITEETEHDHVSRPASSLDEPATTSGHPGTGS